MPPVGPGPKSGQLALNLQPKPTFKSPEASSMNFCVFGHLKSALSERRSQRSAGSRSR